MMKPLKDKLVQSRLDENELARFRDVKKFLGTKTNSETVRQMVVDEIFIRRVQDEWKDGNTDEVMKWVQIMNNLGRPAMAQALMGITDSKSKVMLCRAMDTYQDMQDQLAGLMWSVANISNNLNQIAHVLNTAKSEDPADADTWNWVNSRLSQQQTLNDDLKQQLQRFKQKYLVTKDERSGNSQLSA
ncbi:plasmid mobilization relaxosome protein MobC [Limosilactobacillus agrestimuris]|uniref:plasmid mobilization relaxosome protein MobC n=1 Tax=Limosilactobacillus agrestimuris TaxID=2941331 RepID=UPI00203E0212|nr:plasmid mobilization relaxosome protein MobC [Limosilactobacillus agrestimuris]